MSVYISEKLRKKIIKRAHNLCEYCLFHEEDAFNTFHIEHIIPLKHNGKTILSNLAYACPFCNNFKGTNTVSTTMLFIPGIRIQSKNDRAFQFGFLGLYADNQMLPLPIPMVQWFRKF